MAVSAVSRTAYTHIPVPLSSRWLPLKSSAFRLHNVVLSLKEAASGRPYWSLFAAVHLTSIPLALSYLQSAPACCLHSCSGLFLATDIAAKVCVTLEDSEVMERQSRSLGSSEATCATGVAHTYTSVATEIVTSALV